MNINIWGPGLWEIIHSVAFNYNNINIPENIKRKKYINLFISLIYLIPCNRCKNHYIFFLEKKNIKKYASSYYHIIRWTNHLHNNVNSRLNKKIFTLEESKNKYIKNNKLKISHNKIYNFINNCIYNIKQSQLKHLKTFLNSIIHLYPCDICQKKLLSTTILLQKNNIFIRKIKNIKQLHLLYSKIKDCFQHK